jgi:hypothetical protein
MRWITACLVFAFSALIIASVSVNAEDEPTYENPELQVKFNFKGEGDMLSPQTKLPSEAETTKSVQADVDYDAPGIGKVGRNPVNVGTWTSDPVEFDLSISINSFDIWWEDTEDQDGDDSCEWTITVEHNGASVSEDASDCQHGGTDVAKGTHNLATSIDLVAGDTLGINLQFEGWDDIKIYYDNVTYDTGLNVKGNHLFFFGAMWKGSEINVEFAEAWPTNWDTNLDGGFVMLMGDEGYMADNSMAEVTEGSEYSIALTNGTAEITSTVITWTAVTGTGISLMMDYTTFDHMPAGGNGSANGTDKQALVTVNLMKATQLLGDGDGLLGLPGFEIILAVPALAFVARRFRN